ncbi:type VII secretion-associated serine protease mycosin [Amycolatopsis antarctica]|uniref:Type VII secretion-associated serine protease mycosin n=1 Tax=Amycolatopsis antarctica TaxID=1854586 RepID=A0A263CYT7_9PSEU|nr:type VII secretion-associated serine protease mycosin [Amycolatopsis antarctica]OZM71334.1 type VII secretion-associated serine protease mycosin [Amycolatopsis antarctica]
MKTLSRFLVTTAVAAAVWATAPVPAHAAPPPAGTCPNPEPAQAVITEQPWAQKMLDPETVWQHSTGAGVLVAVVDSGVDSDHPQLGGDKVLPGEDFYLVGDLPGNFDCASHGTAVAGIIGANPADGVGFAGLAPGARILPVRVAERDTDDNGTSQGLDVGLLASGIRYAADQGAKVINLSLSGRVDDPGVREAVAHARSKDALVVAAVGNMGQQDLPGGPTYPSAYDGVLGVGAVDMAGQRLAESQVGPQVDLVAPGGSVASASRAAGHQYWKGSSFAAPFVAASAALVRAAWPALSADEVAERLKATATPAPGGRDSTSYGAGLVNPYRAVTDELTSVAPAAMPMVAPAPVDPEQARLASWWDSAGQGGRLLAVGAGAGALLGAAGVVVLSRGRRSGWRARRAAPVAATREIEEPPDQVFLLPPPSSER